MGQIAWHLADLGALAESAAYTDVSIFRPFATRSDEVRHMTGSSPGSVSPVLAVVATSALARPVPRGQYGGVPSLSGAGLELTTTVAPPTRLWVAPRFGGL
jgi:hypothetical protein